MSMVVQALAMAQLGEAHDKIQKVLPQVLEEPHYDKAVQMFKTVQGLYAQMHVALGNKITPLQTVSTLVMQMQGKSRDEVDIAVVMAQGYKWIVEGQAKVNAVAEVTHEDPLECTIIDTNADLPNVGSLFPDTVDNWE